MIVVTVQQIWLRQADWWLTIRNASKNGVKNVTTWFILGVNDRTDPHLADFIYAKKTSNQCSWTRQSSLSTVVKRQLTKCFKSLKPIQIGLCMLVYLSIHLHGSHIDTQYSQTWRLSTQLRSRERTGHRLLWSATLLLPTLLSDSQVSISLVIRGLWWTVSCMSC